MNLVDRIHTIISETYTKKSNMSTDNRFNDEINLTIKEDFSNDIHKLVDTISKVTNIKSISSKHNMSTALHFITDNLIRGIKSESWLHDVIEKTINCVIADDKMPLNDNCFMTKTDYLYEIDSSGNMRPVI